MTKKHNFEAETGRILELLTHSIYSNKEIFLREVVSNSSDAIDKARIKSLTDTNFLKAWEKFEIKINVNEKNNSIIIEDNGIWMDKESLQKNLWTIAKSGTKEFVEKLKKAKEGSEHNLIWQFWVGFYSAFMVADKVEVDSKTNESEANKWISDWKTGYELVSGEKKERWTRVEIFLNEANKELLSEWKIKELVKKYSNYAPTPIMLEVEEKEEKDWKEVIKGKKWEQINESKAIWKKNKSEIKPEELEEFYKSISMDFNKYLTYSHINIEWMVSYKSLLFVPMQKNMFNDLSDPNKEYWPKLYIQNVLILENAKELLPVWLRFVSWVVETSDLPLNISREMLQNNSSLEKIKKGLVKKVLAELKKSMKNDEKNYDIFLENYAKLLKEWVYYETWEQKEEIASILKFKNLEWKNISLDEYLENSITLSPESSLPDGEKGATEEKIIYYVVWKSESEVLASPYLSQFRENNVDVLLLTDPIDSFLVQNFNEYKKAKLKSITSSDIKLKQDSKEEKEKKEEVKKDFKDFLELTKNTISADKIEKVELNENLWEAIWALKTPEWWVNPEMEKMMKTMGQPVPEQKRILELNPNTGLVKSMKAEFEKDLKSEKLSDMIKYAYNQAILLEWGELENIADFVALTNKFAGKYLK